MLHTILGIACFDPDFREALFKHSTTTVHDYGYYVRGHDSILLEKIFADQSLQSGFEAVNKGTCTHKPCPALALEVLSVIGAALLDEPFRRRLFEDPIPAARERGFVIRYPETYVLATLMHGENGERLKRAIEALAGRLLRITEKAEAQLVA